MYWVPPGLHKSPSVVNKRLHDSEAISLVIFVVIALMEQVLGRDVGPIKFLPFFEPRDTKNLELYAVCCML